MKKIVAGLMLTFASMSSFADLCTIITKDPRYAVASYVRNQTACRTTTHAGASNIGAQVARIGAIIVVASAVSYLIEQNQKAKTEEILSDDYKTLSCSKSGGWHPSVKPTTYEFLVGKEHAINKGTGNIYSKSSNGVYERGNFTSYKLDLHNMTVTGNGLMGNADLTCMIMQEVRNGEVGEEFLIVAKWEDSNTDTFKVFAQSSAKAIDMVKEKFANSHTKVVDVYYNLAADPKTAIAFQ